MKLMSTAILLPISLMFLYWLPADVVTTHTELTPHSVKNHLSQSESNRHVSTASEEDAPPTYYQYDLGDGSVNGYNIGTLLFQKDVNSSQLDFYILRKSGATITNRNVGNLLTKTVEVYLTQGSSVPRMHVVVYDQANYHFSGHEEYNVADWVDFKVTREYHQEDGVEYIVGGLDARDAFVSNSWSKVKVTQDTLKVRLSYISTGATTGKIRMSANNDDVHVGSRTCEQDSTGVPLWGITYQKTCN